jgi:exonuclease III
VGEAQEAITKSGKFLINGGNIQKQKKLNIKGTKTIRIATQNIQKGVEDKIEQIEKMMKELNIDILITQEWAGWDVEEYKFRKCIEGYTNFMSFKKKKGRKASNISILAMNEEERSKQLKKSMQKRKRGTTILIKIILLTN